LRAGAYWGRAKQAFLLAEDAYLYTMRVLVVEDEHKIANAIKQGLEQEAFAVDVAYDGRTGLDLGIGETYDIIILDRLLPEMDGIEICRKLRDNKIHTPVLFLTAKGQVADRVEGLNAGADDYLVKPFAFEELLARVRALQRRPKDTVGQVLTFEDLSMDLTSYAVQRGNKQIHLSSKEFALLEYFLRHPNKILTKEQIINHVWNYDAEILPNTVEVYVGYLRNKIDKSFKKPLLHTVRGFGYALRVES
jgi:DNA-binding response OmpR family regulator